MDAVVFLKKHEQTLTQLRLSPEVEDIRLDFPIDLRVDRKKVFAQFDYFPPALVSLAGALGVGLELSIYPRDLEQLARARSSSRKRSGISQRQPQPREAPLANKPLSGVAKRARLKR